MEIEFIKKIKSAKGDLFVIDSNQFNIDRNRYPSKKDFQAQVIQLVLTAIIGKHTLLHHKSGAPYLKDSNYNISISHCDQLFAIYISTTEVVGVDIETIKKDINKAKPFFINANEQNVNWEFESLYIIWCAKEAIYKSNGGNIEDLAQEVTIKKITEHQVFYTFDCKTDSLNFIKYDNWILTYT